MKHSTIKARLEKAIRDLGPTVKSAEKVLIKGDYRGVPTYACRCLLAQYFTACVGEPVKVHGLEADASGLWVDMPGRLRDLIERFDDFRADRRLYPKRVTWTPPIDGWQYRFWRRGAALSVDDSCPIRISGCIVNGRCTGYNGHLTPEEAIAAARAS